MKGRNNSVIADTPQKYVNFAKAEKTHFSGFTTTTTSLLVSSKLGRLEMKPIGAEKKTQKQGENIFRVKLWLKISSRKFAKRMHCNRNKKNVIRCYVLSSGNRDTN
jgi:hypothetical protein